MWQKFHVSLFFGQHVIFLGSSTYTHFHYQFRSQKQSCIISNTCFPCYCVGLWDWIQSTVILKPGRQHILYFYGVEICVHFWGIIIEFNVRNVEKFKSREGVGMVDKRLKYVNRHKSLNVTLSTHAIHFERLTRQHKSIKRQKNWWFFIFVYHCFGFEWKSAQRRWKSGARTMTENQRERLKHVTNDLRLDLSFIIVSDTCPRHHPLFCRLRNNNSVLYVARLGTWFLLYRQLHKSKHKKKRQRDTFADRMKKSHILWKHKHVFNISASKQDKLRFNQLWKCTHVSLHVVSHLHPSAETHNFPIKTFLPRIHQQIKLQIESNNIIFCEDRWRWLLMRGARCETGRITFSSLSPKASCINFLSSSFCF